MSIEEDNIDAQRRREATASGGASIRSSDPRVSQFIQWVWATLGAGVIGAVLYVGSQLGGLRDAVADTNLQVALSRQQTTAILEELKDHEGRLRENEGDVRDIRARLGINMRGGPAIVTRER